MDSFSGDNEESTEDISKRKSSRIKSLKTLFRRTKKTGAGADAKLTQSASDITAGKGLGSEEDLASLQVMMGSRAFSHDSIFMADQDLSDSDPPKVSSQENVHSKIKSLQIKLQQQKMHFGPPPMVLPIRSPEETAYQSEDFPFSSYETSGEGTFTKTISQSTSPPVSPVSRLAEIRSQPQMPFFSFSLSRPNYSSPTAIEAPIDFTSPAEFTSSLDTSAARHRMSIKPRNQRASSKRKPFSGTGSDLRDRTTPDRFELAQEQEKDVVAQEREAEETERGQVNCPQLSPLKFEEVSPASTVVGPKLPSQSFTQQENALPESNPIFQVKLPRSWDQFHSKRPHSSYMESEMKEKREADFDRQLISQNKRNAFYASMTEVSSDQHSPFSSLLGSRPSFAQEQRDEDSSTRRKRPSSGYEAIYLSRNWEEDRPRSESFKEVLEKSKTRAKSFGETQEKIKKEKEEVKSFTEVLEKPEFKIKSFGGAGEKITGEKEEVIDFTEVLEKPESKTKSIFGTEKKITREKEEVTDFTDVLVKPEFKTKSFRSTEEKIKGEKEELTDFTEVLVKPEFRLKSFRSTEDKITRGKEEVAGFIKVNAKPEFQLRSIGTTEQKIPKGKEEVTDFTEVLIKPEFKLKSIGGKEEKITTENEEVKGFTDVLAKPEFKRESFRSTEEKIPKGMEEMTEILIKPEFKLKSFGGTEEKIPREKEELKSLQPKGSPLAADKTRGSSLPWERNASFKKTEPVTPTKTVHSDPFIVESVRVDCTLEPMNDTEESKELPGDETKTPFGVKLRSTSQSFRFRSEKASQSHSAALLSDDQSDKRKCRQNIGDGSSQMSEKILAHTSNTIKSLDAAQFGVTLPVRQNNSLEVSSQATPSELQTASISSREAETTPLETQPTPQTSSSDVSWMSLAMEKTRSLQHLLTSRFQRDTTGAHSAARPKSQEETSTGSQMQAQAEKIQQSATQPSLDTTKEESFQSSSQEQTVKPSTAATQKKMTLISQFESLGSRDSPLSRQMSQRQAQPNKAQLDAQTVPRPTQSSSPSSPQIGTTSPFTRGTVPQLIAQPYQSSVQQQTSSSNRGLQPAAQIKPAPPALESEPAVTSAAASTLDSAFERRERESSVPKESPSLTSKRVLWTGSMADRVAFMEKRAEWSTPPVLKEAEPRKAQTQMQSSNDTDTLAKLFPSSKDTEEIRQRAKSAESSPSRVLEKPREDKWTRKNVESPSNPSSLHTLPSALQSDSGQPSWMELAKRKSMAWSDKSMD